jgi:hypothetical protein
MQTAKQTAVNTAINSVYQPIEQRPSYKTVEQFSNDNPCFTPSSLRNLIFKADKRLSSNGVIAGNGLLEVGAIIRIGRKVLINEDRFYQWIESQNAGSQK